jgi:hypothetical protein
MNNRQNGRRRGRGGQQARSGQPGGPDRGNRLDNRARGNAAQLLEKYKNLARDAQMQGDRVNTEYYLQFADHYFRVLNENRARFEEQRPRQHDYRDDFGGEEEGGDANQQRFQGRDDQGGEESWEEGEQPSVERQAERQRAPRRERQAQPSEDEGSPEAEGRQSEGSRQSEGNGERRRERGRRNGNGNGHVNGNGFSAPDFLSEPISPRFEAVEEAESENPPRAAEAAEQDEAAPKRRRTRRPRGESAPAEA